MSKNQPEYQIHKTVCEYLRWKYPTVLFLTDLDNQIKLTQGQAKRNKALQHDKFKCPDLIIFAPSVQHHGLFIEFKAKSPYKIDGVTLLKNEHIEAQWQSILDLRLRGYAADFAWTVEMAIQQIDNYMKRATGIWKV